MPQVQNGSFIAYIPQVYTIYQGSSNDLTLVLYQNSLGNQIEAYNAQGITVEIFDTQMVLKNTFTKAANQLTFGSTTNQTEGYVTFTLDATSSSAIQAGDVYAKVTINYSNNTVVLPKLKLASMQELQGGGTVGSLGNTFTVPAPTYAIQSADYSTGDMPAAGKIVTDNLDPYSITRIVYNNTDDRGKRNAYLENVLNNRYTSDGAGVNIIITDTADTSKYVIYRVTGWSRMDIDNDSTLTGYGDGLNIQVQFESISRTEAAAFSFVVGQRVGTLVDAYGGGGTSGGGGGSISVNDGITSVDPASDLIFADGFTITDIGGGTARIEHVANFTSTQVNRLKQLVYEDGAASLSVAPTSFEKNTTLGTNLTFTYSTTTNDDTVQSATYNGNDVTLTPNGSEVITGQKITISRSFNVTFLNSDGVTTRNDNNSKTATALDPQWFGVSSSTDFDGSTYTQLNSALTRFVAASPAKEITVSPSSEYVYFLSTKSGATIYDGNNFDNTSDFDQTTISVEYEDGSSLTLYQYKTKTTKTLSGFTYRLA